jgi:uncharacterized protein (DUF952 family)
MHIQPPDRYILHIAPRSQWEQAKDQDAYRAETLESDGFIHCSRVHQVLAVAGALFSERHDLILLLIETSKILSPLRYEGGTPESYPQTYGPINREAIIAAYDFLPDGCGAFSLPQAVIERCER